MTKLLKGAPVVEALNARISAQAAQLREAGVVPTLAILRVGENPDDIAYERGAVKRCEKVGVDTRLVSVEGNCTQESLLQCLHEQNVDETVHGVLLLRPLPKGIDDNTVRNLLRPEKDVDGITDASLAGVFAGEQTGYPPCTAQACMEILDHYGIDPKGKRTVVVGRSLVVGKPVSMMLVGRHATVTMCHTRTVDMPAVCREAELLIVSAGQCGMVDESYLAAGQTVIDVGINVDENGKLCGDVQMEAADGLVGAITPVPGGVGTVTTSVLAKHVVEAAAKAARK